MNKYIKCFFDYFLFNTFSMNLLFIKYPFNFGKSFIKFKKLLHFYEIPLFVEQVYKNFIYIFALSI